MTNQTNPQAAPELDAADLDQVVGGGVSGIVVHQARNQEQADKLTGGTTDARKQEQSEK